MGSDAGSEGRGDRPIEVADAGARKQREEVRDRNEERYRSLIKATSAIIWTADPQGAFIEPQPSWEAYTGQPWEQSKGRGWLDMIHPDDRPALLDQWAGIAATGGEYHAGTRRLWHGATRSYRYVVARAVPIRYPDGSIREWVGTTHDVHAEHETATALRASEERWRMLIEAMPQLVWSCTPEGLNDYLSPQWLALTGVPAEQQYGRGWLKLLHPDDRQRTTQVWKAAVEGRGAYDLEFRVRRADGEYRWMKTRAVPERDAEGKTVRWLGTCTDISEIVEARETLARSREELERIVAKRTRQVVEANERLRAEIAERRRAEAVLKEGEERYRELYNRTPLALHSVDDKARIIDVNDHWLQLFGYEREEVLGRSPPDFMAEESARLYRESAWPDMLRTDGAVRTFEYRFVKRSGEIFDGRVSSRGEWDAEGGFVRTWAATADITAQKHAEAQLVQSQKMEVVGQLTGGIAHDFNNLLTVFSGNLDLIERRAAGNEHILQLAAAAQRATERGARLTEHLLAFSRRKKLHPETVNVRDLVRAFEGLLKRAVGEAIDVEISADSPLWSCHVDPAQLETALLNLALNARDAMLEGGKLTIDMRNASFAEEPSVAKRGAKPYVMIAVSDTGCGMSPEIAGRAFEPFFTTKNVGKGTGLGLSMVYGFVKQSGGHVVIHSTSGSGAKIVLYLPKSEQTEAAQSEPDRDQDDRPTGSNTILVVEDDAAVLDVTSLMLADLGYAVLTARTGAEALDVLRRREDIRLLLTDVVMPGGMSGVDLGREARRMSRKVKVMLISGYAEDVLTAHQAHDEFPILGKPLRQGPLARAIRSLLATPV